MIDLTVPGILIFLLGLVLLLANVGGKGTVSLGKLELNAPVSIVVMIFGIIVAFIKF
jgi:hypothetical protein